MVKLISKIALLVVTIAILYLLFSESLLSSSPIIIAVQLSALALSIWARRSFHKGQFSIHAQPGSGQLISTGPYRFIRHPMYTFSLAIVWSSILGHLNSITLGISIVVTFVIIIRIVTEEQFLIAHYPEYAEYSRKTKRIIPFIF